MANINKIRLSGQTYDIQDSNAQPLLTAGQGITIENNVISATGGGSITVDTALDSGSTNPVQNKVIYNKIDEVEEVTAAGFNALNDKINPTVELTQAQYDALVSGGTVDPNTYYIITDAQGVDISNYWTSAQTNSAINAAVSNKVDKSAVTSSVTSASTDTEIPTAKAVFDAVEQGGGGSITIDPSLNSGSTNAVANSAITNAFNTYTIYKNTDNGETRYFYWSTPKKPYGDNIINNFSINGRCPLTKTNGSNTYIDKFNLVETSAVTSSVTSASTDSQIPTAKAVYDAIPTGGTVEVSSAITSGDTNAVAGGAVYDKFDEVEQVTAAGLNAVNSALGGLKLQQISQSAYNSLTTKDSSTLYIIVN